MRRRLIHALLVLAVGTLPTAFGVVIAVLATTPGRELLSRSLSRFLDGVLRGNVEIGRISGSFVFGVELENLVIRDTAGEVFAAVPRLEASYRLPNLLAGRVLLAELRLDQPFLQFIKRRDGRMNYEEILRLGESAGGGPGTLVEFRRVRVNQGTLRVAVPWDPGPPARTDAERAASLARERARPGRLIEDSREGLRKVVQASMVTAAMPVMRLSSPDRAPVTIDLDTLAARVNDPGVTFTDFLGRVVVQGDSVRLTVTRAAFPATEFTGEGVLSFPRDTLLLDLDLEVRRLDLRDVRWVSPDFPAMTGRTTLRALSLSGARTEYRLTDLHLEGGPGRLDGELIAITDAARGLGVRDMRVTTAGLDLETVRPYLDTLPLVGTVTGPLAADGFFDDMRVTLDLAYAEARLPGAPVSRLQGNGRLALGGDQGMEFRAFTLEDSDLDLTSVRLMAPAVVLEGRAALRGTLDGPWKAVTFAGVMEHRDRAGPVSVMEGSVRLDTRRDPVGIDADVILRPLDFDGIRRGFPALAATGAVTGRVRTRGFLDRLAVNFDLTGALGRVSGEGGLTLLPPRYGADSLALEFTDLDLAAVRGGGQPTRLTGRALVTARTDTLRAPEVDLTVRLGPGWVREVYLDSVKARLAIHDSVIRLDTLEADWGGVRTGGRISGSGSLGYRRPHDGRMTFFAAASSLTPFDSLVMALTGATRDTAANAVPLSGAGTVRLSLAGALDSHEARGDASLEGLAWQTWRVPFSGGTFAWTGGPRPRLDLGFQSDSIDLDGLAYRAVDVRISGWADSLGWEGSLQSVPEGRFSGGGRWWRGDTAGWTLALDTLTAALPAHTWRLERPAQIRVSRELVGIDSLALATDDGSGRIRLAGAAPRAAPGDLRIEAQGLHLQDLYALIQRDTAGVGGSIGLDVQVAGTAAQPTISGTGTMGDLFFGDFRSPFVQGVFDYRDRRLDANLLLWRTGAPVLQVEARLPLNLALKSVARRQIPGELYIRASADSVDLAIMEAFTPNLRRVTGLLRTDLEVRGSWDAPRLAGSLDVERGGATVPSLGIRYGQINGRLRFNGDSIVVERVRATSGQGDVVVTGAVRLERLTRPVLGLSLRARDFLAIDSRAFLTLAVSGNGTLTGPVLGATLRGDIVARSGVLHFADLVNKRIVDLADPSAQDLVDTMLIRSQDLGTPFQSRFLDSLDVQDLRLTVQEQFWLRSSDANIQLEGAIVVNKAGPEYRFDGTLNAIRGTYTLKIGFVTRDFQVDRGTVRYFGTPDFNAELDIQATHVVQTATEEIPVVAKITGTLLLPKLSLESTIRPAPTESELVSYLMFGRPSPELPGLGAAENAQSAAAFEAGLAYLASALSSEIQRTLVSDVGIPIDFIEIRTGGSTTLAGGRTQIAAGWQLGNRAFFILNAGVCRTDLSTLGARNIGAGLEYRLSRVWRFQASVEPIFDCSPSGGTTTPTGSTRYQFGLDLQWSKEY